MLSEFTHCEYLIASNVSLQHLDCIMKVHILLRSSR